MSRNFAVGLVTLIFGALLLGKPALAKPRNFVFILVDDLGQKDIGIEGSTFHETPNIDKLRG